MRILMLFVWVLLSGCPSILMVGCASRDNRAWYMPDPITDGSLDEGEEDGRINPQRYVAPMAIEKTDGRIDKGFTEQDVCLYAYASNFLNDTAKGKERRKLARNLLQEKLLELSNDAVDRHFSDVLGWQDGTNLILGGSAIGLSTAGALVAGGAGQVFSGAAAALLGTKALVAEEVYAKSLPEVMLKRVKAERKEMAQVLALNRLERSIDEYSVGAAVQDALIYHSTGSFQHALSLVVSDTQKAATFSDDMARLAQIDLGDGNPQGARQTLKAAITETPYSTSAGQRYGRITGQSWLAWVEDNGRMAAAERIMEAYEAYDDPASTIRRDFLQNATDAMRLQLPLNLPLGATDEQEAERNRATLEALFETDDPAWQNFLAQPDKLGLFLRQFATKETLASLLNSESLGLAPPQPVVESPTNREAKENRR